MIIVTATETTIIMAGHAGAHKDGIDLVCCAASVLEENFIQSVNELTQDKITADLDSGLAVIALPDKMSAETKTLYKSLLLGLKTLESMYPENVSVRIEDSMVLK